MSVSGLVQVPSFVTLRYWPTCVVPEITGATM